MFVLLSGSLFGQGRDNLIVLTKGDRIEDLVIRFNELGEFNGSVLVVENGSIIYENTIGLADTETMDPLDASMPFYLASLSKQFTSEAVLILKQEGKLSLDDPLKKYLPLMPKIYNGITIRHLLTHTSGVKDYISTDIIHPGLTNQDVYKMLITRRSLDFPPGQKFRYSNSGYVLLAMIIEVASGQRYPDFLQKKIFGPLKMDHTFVMTDIHPSMDLVKGYTEKWRPDDYHFLTYGDGGIYSTAMDLYKWDRALKANSLIPSDVQNQAYLPTRLVNGSVRRYGFGWEIGENSNGKIVYHSGGLNGFRTYIERQMGEDNSIILLNNTSSEKILSMRNLLVKILDNRPYALPEDK